MTFVFRSEAAADVVGARDWYDEQVPGLGLAFADALDHVLSIVSRLPESCPLVLPNVRRALLPRFPYALYYRIGKAAEIEILACLHTRRSPHIIRSRSTEA